MQQIHYEIRRSRRKTLGMEIRDGAVLVRAPLFCSDREIESFVRSHQRWILTHLQKVQAAGEAVREQGYLSEEEIRTLMAKARRVIPERVRYYAPLVGVTYGRITIRCQKTRWGSCSSKGNLNFNCLLMLAPPQVLDSVVVHELCHRKYMNHSRQFYSEVLRIFPEYRKWHSWLTRNGPVLLGRAAK